MQFVSVSLLWLCAKKVQYRLKKNIEMFVNSFVRES